MKGDNRKVAEVMPCGVEKTAPIKDEAVDRRATIELCAHRLKDEACVDIECFKGALGHLEGVGALKDRHAWFDFWVYRGG